MQGAVLTRKAVGMPMDVADDDVAGQQRRPWPPAGWAMLEQECGWRGHDGQTHAKQKNQLVFKAGTARL